MMFSIKLNARALVLAIFSLLFSLSASSNDYDPLQYCDGACSESARKYAYLAAATYKGYAPDKIVRTPYGPSYELVSNIRNPEDGFYAEMYRNVVDRSEIVISFRGTDDLSDWTANVGQCRLPSSTPLQLQEANYYVEEIVNTNPSSRSKIHITGHSLGGGLATFAAIENNLPATVFAPAALRSERLGDFSVDRPILSFVTESSNGVRDPVPGFCFDRKYGTYYRLDVPITIPFPKTSNSFALHSMELYASMLLTSANQLELVNVADEEPLVPEELAPEILIYDDDTTVAPTGLPDANIVFVTAKHQGSGDSFSRELTANPGDKITIRVVANNKGEAPFVDPDIEYFIDGGKKNFNGDSDDEVGEDDNVGQLDPGEWYEDQKQHVSVPEIPGEYWIYVCIEDDSDPEEVETGNNCSKESDPEEYVKLTVQSYDIAATGVTAGNNEIRQGDTFQLRGKLTNVGSSDFPDDIVVRFYLDDNYIYEYIRTAYYPPPGGEEEIWSSPLDSSTLSVGQHTIKMVVDTQNVLAESDEVNNTSVSVLNVVPAPNYNIAADGLSVGLETTGNYVVRGAQISPRFLLQNLGDSLIEEDTKISLYHNNVEIQSSIRGAYHPPYRTTADDQNCEEYTPEKEEICGQYQHWFDSLDTSDWPEGVHTLEVAVDSANMVSEVNEADNRVEISIQVKSTTTKPAMFLLTTDRGRYLRDSDGVSAILLDSECYTSLVNKGVYETVVETWFVDSLRVTTQSMSCEALQERGYLLSAGQHYKKGLIPSTNGLLAGKTEKYLGVNLTSGEYACATGNNPGGWGIFEWDGEGVSDTDIVSLMDEFGANTVRIPLNSHCWLGGFAYISDQFSGEAYRARIRQFVGTMSASNKYVILDLHWAAAFNRKAVRQPQLADADYAAIFWNSVASEYRDNGRILFDVFNEPHIRDLPGLASRTEEDKWKCWKDGCVVADDDGYYLAIGMDFMIAAIRATGAQQPIIASGLDFAGDLSGWLDFAPYDSARKTIAGFHAYDTIHADGTIYYKQCVTAADCFDPIVKPLHNKYGVIISEAGESVGDTSVCSANFTPLVYGWANGSNVGYTAWALNPHSCEAPSLLTNWFGDRTPGGDALKSAISAANEIDLEPPPPSDGFVFSRTDKPEFRWIEEVASTGELGSVWISPECASRFGAPEEEGDWNELIAMAPAFDSIPNPCDADSVTYPEPPPPTEGFVFSRTDKPEFRWIGEVASTGELGSVWISPECASRFGAPEEEGDWNELIALAPAFDSIPNPCDADPLTDPVPPPATGGFVFSRTDKPEFRWIEEVASTGELGSVWISSECASRFGAPEEEGDWNELIAMAPAFDSIPNPCDADSVTDPEPPPPTEGFVFSRTDKPEFRWIGEVASTGELGSVWISPECASRFGAPEEEGDWIDLIVLAPAFDAIPKPCD